MQNYINNTIIKTLYNVSRE